MACATFFHAFAPAVCHNRAASASARCHRNCNPGCVFVTLLVLCDLLLHMHRDFLLRPGAIDILQPSMLAVCNAGKALKLSEEQRAADQLRKQVCDKMHDKRDDISPFLELDFDEYIERMSQSYTWGGEPELSVVPDCLHRTVEVYMNGANGLQVMSTYLSDQKDKDPVKVLFNGIGHYDLLVTDSAKSKL